MTQNQLLLGRHQPIILMSIGPMLLSVTALLLGLVISLQESELGLRPYIT